MIGFLDDALKNLLLRELSFLDELKIHFEAPDREFNPGVPAIDLFLYDVRENLELRSNEWQSLRDISMDRNAAPLPAPPARVKAKATTWRAPVRVDCSYLITAWSGPQDIKGEHNLLGEVMRGLLRYPTLPFEVLPQELQDQQLPLPTGILQPSYLQSAGEFWQALDGKPKAALNYKVTIAVHPFARTETPLVIESSADIKPIARDLR